MGRLHEDLLSEDNKYPRQRWHKPLIPALAGQRQAGLCGLEANLVYRMSAMTGSVNQKQRPPQKNKKNALSTV